MILELMFTSVKTGLKPGSNGFCTVAATSAMPESLIRKLETFSNYIAAFKLNDSRVGMNPISFKHALVRIGSMKYSILSRVCYCGADFQGRFNIFAHHLALDSSERSQCPAGPAWVMLPERNIMSSQWTGKPRLLEPGRARIPTENNPLRICRTWGRLAGDPGWAGVLANAFMQSPGEPSYIIYPPGTDVLPLVNEALCLLPENKRWSVSFNTYFTGAEPGVECDWRFCLAGEAAAGHAKQNATSGVVIDLTNQEEFKAPAGIFVEMARTGQHVTSVPKPPADELQAKKNKAEQIGITPPQIETTGTSGYQDFQTDSGAIKIQDDLNRKKPTHEWKPVTKQTGTVAWKKNILFAIAIIWPVVVLALGSLVFVPSQNSKPIQDNREIDSEQETADQALIASLEEKLEERDNRVAQQAKKIEERDNRVARQAKKIEELEKQNKKITDAARAQPEEAKEESENDTPEANETPDTSPDDSAEKSEPQTTDTQRPAPKTAMSNGRVFSKIDCLLVPSGFGNVPVPRCKSLELKVDTVPGVSSIKLNLPENGAGEKTLPEHFKLTSSKNKVEIFFETIDPLDGSKISKPLAQVMLGNGEIIWEWKKISLSESNKKHLPGLNELLKYSTLTAYSDDKKEMKRYQFVKKSNTPVMVLMKSAGPVITKPIKWCPYNNNIKPRWMPLPEESGDVWKVSYNKEKPTELVVMLKAYHKFTIQLNLEKGEDDRVVVDAHWGEKSSPDKIQRDIEASKQNRDETKIALKKNLKKFYPEKQNRDGKIKRIEGYRTNPEWISEDIKKCKNKAKQRKKLIEEKTREKLVPVLVEGKKKRLDIKKLKELCAKNEKALEELSEKREELEEKLEESKKNSKEARKLESRIDSINDSINDVIKKSDYYDDHINKLNSDKKKELRQLDKIVTPVTDNLKKLQNLLEKIKALEIELKALNTESSVNLPVAVDGSGAVLGKIIVKIGN